MYKPMSAIRRMLNGSQRGILSASDEKEKTAGKYACFV
jgi:hypothetical protein